VHEKKIKECKDCGKTLTGHGSPKRCKRCAARQRYIDIHGKPPEMIIANCDVCGKEYADYKSNHAKGEKGVYLCSRPCKNEWVGVKNSIKNGGDGKKRTKSEKDKRYYRVKSENIRKKSREYYWKNRDSILKKGKERSRQVKLKVINHYGGKCECCGEDVVEFLTIDHIHNNGNEHRKALKGKGIKVYEDIIKNNYPENEFRVLCFNCNITRGFYGYCPHKPDEIFVVPRVSKNPGRRKVIK